MPRRGVPRIPGTSTKKRKSSTATFISKRRAELQLLAEWANTTTDSELTAALKIAEELPLPEQFYARSAISRDPKHMLVLRKFALGSARTRKFFGYYARNYRTRYHALGLHGRWIVSFGTSMNDIAAKIADAWTETDRTYENWRTAKQDERRNALIRRRKIAALHGCVFKLIEPLESDAAIRQQMQWQFDEPLSQLIDLFLSKPTVFRYCHASGCVHPFFFAEHGKYCSKECEAVGRLATRLRNYHSREKQKRQAKNPEAFRRNRSRRKVA